MEHLILHAVQSCRIFSRPWSRSTGIWPVIWKFKSNKTLSVFYSSEYVYCINFYVFCQITGNDNGYQASITKLETVYNARYIKIKSTATNRMGFCIRIELCGKGNNSRNKSTLVDIHTYVDVRTMVRHNACLELKYFPSMCDLYRQYGWF
jgi:hypothetical protein